MAMQEIKQQWDEIFSEETESRKLRVRGHLAAALDEISTMAEEATALADGSRSPYSYGAIGALATAIRSIGDAQLQLSAAGEQAKIYSKTIDVQ
jgi:hypothetical protein